MAILVKQWVSVFAKKQVVGIERYWRQAGSCWRQAVCIWRYMMRISRCWRQAWRYLRRIWKCRRLAVVSTAAGGKQCLSRGAGGKQLVSGSFPGCLR